MHLPRPFSRPLSRGWHLSRTWVRGQSSWANEKTKNIKIPNGPTLHLNQGKLAKFADGAVVASIGDTSVLTTAVAPAPPPPLAPASSESSSSGQKLSLSSFVPLTVDYRQKSAAAGRIPTNFLRRELGPSEKEILISRVIDRSLRPLFPSGYGHEVQLVCNLLAVDGNHDPDVIAINAASAALATSDIPWKGPVGAVRVGYVDQEFLVNPTRKHMAKSKLNLIVTGSASKATIMLEAEADNVEPNLFLDGIRVGLESCAVIATEIGEFAQQVGVQKRSLENTLSEVPEAVLAEMKSLLGERLLRILHHFNLDKVQRGTQLYSIRDDAVDQLKRSFTKYDVSVFHSAFSTLCREAIASMALNESVRVDGRKVNEVRHLMSESGIHEPLHGSSLFQRGQTQVFCTVALDSIDSALKADPVSVLTGGVREKNFFVHYEFPPYATNEIGKTSPGRREMGHGALAEKALRSVIPKDYPFTIRLTSEVLESNGSSSMATVCGGTLALLDAGIPISHSAAGVAVGAVHDKGRFKVLLDILGLEDYLGEMDFKVAGTRMGITALQADIKLSDGLPFPVVKNAMALGHSGIRTILDHMAGTRQSPRQNKTNLPVSEALSVPVHKRAKLIGPGGINLKRLTLNTGVQFTAKSEGEWSMFAPNADALAEAKEIIEEILAEEPMPDFQMGGIYPVKIIEIREKSVLVQLHPSLEPCFIPLSQLTAKKVVHTSVLDLNEGDEIKVKFFGRDPVTGAVRLSRKAIELLSTSATQTLKDATMMRKE